MYCIRKLDSILYLVEGVAFYPASGYRYHTSGVFNVTGSYSFAWSCAVSGANGYFLGFYSTGVSPTSVNSRSYGFPVRCVQNL